MSPLLIVLIVSIVLAIGGTGYGYYNGPAGGGVSPLVSILGLVALILIVAFVVLLLTGWRFGLEISPP